ncbi:MAG: hypothetical protein R6W76_18300 [Caldilinea sp.]
MKRIVMIGMALMLLALVAGAARAASDAALPALQRATPTPTAVLRIPVTLAVLPLPAPVLITPTVAITATPALLATPVSIGTPARVVTPSSTPTRRTAPTPTPAQRSSPTPTLTLTPTAVADTSGGIVDFRASTSRVRGQVQLSWRYVGDPFDGDFVVERSANGGAWRHVADCSQPYDPDADIYRCRDEGLTSGSAYEYRACVGEAVYSCSGAPFAETDAIKAP